MQATESVPDVPVESVAVRPDEVCLRDAFRESATALYSFILRRVGWDREVADELLQECCYQAARSLRRPSRPEALPAWFLGIGRNLVRRHWRKLRRARRAAGGGNAFADISARIATEPLPPEVLQSKETAHALFAAMHELREHERELLLAHYFDGRSVVDVANALGATTKAIEGRLRRARERLRVILGNAARSGGL